MYILTLDYNKQILMLMRQDTYISVKLIYSYSVHLFFGAYGISCGDLSLNGG